MDRIIKLYLSENRLPKARGKIVEIFRSIQGEGKYTGCEMVFIRMAGCNINRCSYCDTNYSLYCEMDGTEVMEEVNHILRLHSQIKVVSITGGEPLIQAGFLKTLLPLLKRRNLSILLETNGTLVENYDSISGLVNIVSVGVKLPRNIGGRQFWREHSDFIRSAAEKDLYIKVVVEENTDNEEFSKAVSIVKEIDTKIMFIIQPESDSAGKFLVSAKRIDELCYKAKYCLENVRIGSQMHKLMGVR